MSGQKPLHILKTSKYWSVVQKFLDDESQELLELPRSVNSTDRDVIRQICKHFDVPFKVSGEGTEKVMVLRRPDFSYLENPEENQIGHHLTEMDHWRTLAVDLAIELQKSRQESKDRAVCARCTKYDATLMNRNCGHLVCPSCGQEERCAVCDKFMGELISVETAKRQRLD
jgi:hypothetical protein